MTNNKAGRPTALAAFEQVYRDHCGDVTAFHARRVADPQTVADLTSETFVQAMRSFTSYDPRRGSSRAWLIGIARRVFAEHCEITSRRANVAGRLAGRRTIEIDEADELSGRIDAERAGRQLLARLGGLPEAERMAIELVDLAGMSPGETAAAMGVSRGTLRVRLHRARTKLRHSQADRTEITWKAVDHEQV